MRGYDVSGARRRRSVYVNGDGGKCFDVADGVPGVVPVPDSEVADGSEVLIGRATWVRFVRGMVG
ncbi:DUF397 domain-containing protein [Streptomyces sp. NPDC090057]|uniref:DUF397 domain-containing protein n=1 Tax=Streptomyces sp. NPDC090057 TaxID=3365935 RepID=UPI00381900E5